MLLTETESRLPSDALERYGDVGLELPVSVSVASSPASSCKTCIVKSTK